MKVVPVKATVPLTVLGSALLFAAGCFTHQPDRESPHDPYIAHQEWEETNGMSWPSDHTWPEMVMTPGMVISAQTPQGDITIRAAKDYERFYTWDGATRAAKLWPRITRWLGHMGAYYPGPGNHWKTNHGITRGVLEEGILWFKTTDDALRWINRRSSMGLACVFTDDGLLVTFGRVPERKQLNVEVWQVMVGGEKPHRLPGSQNNLISVTNTNENPVPTPP